MQGSGLETNISSDPAGQREVWLQPTGGGIVVENQIWSRENQMV